MLLVDAAFQGRPRKLMLHADRNGFFYVLDRTNGELLLAKAFAQKISWASGIDAKGRPIELPGNVPTPEGTRTCPDIRGAANWMATAYNPATGLYLRDDHRELRRLPQHAVWSRRAGCQCGGQRRWGARGARGPEAAAGGCFGGPGGDPPRRYLRAIDIQTGKVVWEVDQKVPSPNYGGVLSTAGGVLFYSESTRRALQRWMPRPEVRSGISKPASLPRLRR